MISRFDIALERITAPAGAPWRDTLTSAASGQVTPRATQLARLLRFGLHLARGAAIAALVFPCIGRARRREHVRRWSEGLLSILAVRLQVLGRPSCYPDIPSLLVANHVSWLDILAIAAVVPPRFVAKSEVRTWPVIGWLAEQAGTFFIRRARRQDTARISGKLAQAMREGDAVAVFPEATTTDGSAVLKFHPSLFQPAVLARAALLPVAVRYARGDGTRCLEVAYIDNKSLWASLKLVVGQREIAAEVAFLAPIESDGRHRRELACAAREAILQSLFPPARGSRTETAGDPRAAAR